ncbi:uncharacterized protein GIQ15_03616 [Arthroderma uncinatum]|uniref:uncharacterized protein n=1 Tax=Arthroderma uncinatum TaxID=74035 RepID=UPI00144AF645|nr:uncharacterized protein GIQ15_03616 [Arthroderma uncinatum]KAF3484292.1 hypothetical protein GIQ15_03616 [Arthroderma uncinatum]
MTEGKIEELESRSRAQIGTFKVALHNLRYPGYGDHIRLENERNVQRLVECLHLDNRLDPENYIKALIPSLVAKEALARSGISEADLNSFDPPFLQLKDDEFLTCTEGQHRLKAARELYSDRPAEERWWVVILYNEDGLSDHVRDRMWFCHDNSEKLFDGEIVWNILRCQELGNTDVGRWRLLLSSSKRRDLNRLQTLERFSVLWKALEKLTPFRGLWAVKFFASSRRIFRMINPEVSHIIADNLLSLFRRIPESLQELAAGVLHIVHVWTDICGGADQGKYLDPGTVRELQGRSPRGSITDRRYIKSMFKVGKLFKNIASQKKRQEMVKRALNISTIISSLETFQENTKLLEPPALALRCLLPSRLGGTLLSTFRRHHRQSNVGPEFQVAYRRLWLFALRHFPSLTDKTPLRDNTPPKDTDYLPDAWIKFARLARDEGFNSREISEYLSSMPAGKRTASGPRPFARGCAKSPQGRWSKSLNCGTPYWSAFREAFSDLTLEKIYNEPDPSPELTLSAFSVVRSIFLAFLGSNTSSDSDILPREDLSMCSTSAFSGTPLSVSGQVGISDYLAIARRPMDMGGDEEMPDQLAVDDYRETTAYLALDRPTVDKEGDEQMKDQPTVDKDGDVQILSDTRQPGDRIPKAINLEMIASTLRPESQLIPPGPVLAAPTEQQILPLPETSLNDMALAPLNSTTPHLPTLSDGAQETGFQTPNILLHDTELRDIPTEMYKYAIYRIKEKNIVHFPEPNSEKRVNDFLRNNERMWYALIIHGEVLKLIDIREVFGHMSNGLIVCGYDNNDKVAAEQSLEL